MARKKLTPEEQDKLAEDMHKFWQEWKIKDKHYEDRRPHLKQT